MPHRIKFSVFFHNQLAGAPLDDIGRISLLPLRDKAFAGLDMLITHVFENGALGIFRNKPQEFGAQIGCAFFSPHLIKKNTAETGFAFIGKCALNLSAAKGACHRPAKSAGILAAIDPIV